MKLEDCKPGVRVRVYCNHGAKIGTIELVKDGCVYIKNYTAGYYPQQLRKLVKKNRPEMIVAFYEDGEFDDVILSEDIDRCKTDGESVWLMRGVKKF